MVTTIDAKPCVTSRTTFWSLRRGRTLTLGLRGDSPFLPGSVRKCLGVPHVFGRLTALMSQSGCNLLPPSSPQDPIRTGASPSPPASDRPSAHPHTRPTVPRTLPPDLRAGAGSVPLRNASCMHGRPAHLAARPESATPISTPTRGPCASQSLAGH